MVDKNKLPPHLRNAPSKFDYLKKAHESEPDPNAPKHLGMMNAWGTDPKKYPKEYRHCQVRKRKHAHVPSREKKGRAYIEYECEICKIKWSVDSSD